MTAENDPRPGSSLSGEKTITTIGATPVTTRGISWLPVSQLFLWGIFSRAAASKRPQSCPLGWIWEGFLKMGVTLGSEWCHNLAHLVTSNLIGKPMDRFRIQFGMPRCIYEEINDLSVSPKQHIIRSLGGPLFNLTLLPLAWLWRRIGKDSILGRTARTAMDVNLFLGLVSLLPIPGIDGGPILKWTLVEKGASVPEADQAVRRVNGPLALGLGLFSSGAFARNKHLTGWLSFLLGLISLSIFAGWIKEEEVKI
jgi:hypothetical protein